MSERTPGPWRLVIAPGMGPDGEPYFYIEAEKAARKGLSLSKATCVVDPELGILTEDDARLIAAAPALLATLLAVRRAINTDVLRFSENANLPTRAGIGDQINVAIALAPHAGARSNGPRQTLPHPDTPRSLSHPTFASPLVEGADPRRPTPADPSVQ